MERLNYSEVVIDILREHLHQQGQQDDVESQLLIDSKNHHYQLLHVGWQGEHRIYGCPIHIDIKDGKIWIQQDYTEVGIAQQLTERSVPKSDIVLGFRSPFMRQLSDFATE